MGSYFESSVPRLDDWTAVALRERLEVFGRLGGEVLVAQVWMGGHIAVRSWTVPVASLTRTSVGPCERGPGSEVRFHGNPGVLGIPIHGPDGFDFVERLADDAGVPLLASRPEQPVLTDEARVRHAAREAAETLSRRGVSPERFRARTGEQVRGWRAFEWFTVSSAEGGYMSAGTTT